MAPANLVHGGRSSREGDLQNGLDVLQRPPSAPAGPTMAEISSPVSSRSSRSAACAASSPVFMPPPGVIHHVPRAGLLGVESSRRRMRLLWLNSKFALMVRLVRVGGTAHFGTTEEGFQFFSMAVSLTDKENSKATGIDTLRAARQTPSFLRCAVLRNGSMERLDAAVSSIREKRSL